VPRDEQLTAAYARAMWEESMGLGRPELAGFLVRLNTSTDPVRPGYTGYQIYRIDGNEVHLWGISE
jgi:hypothetical protein